jgi:hypothetical protein
MQMKNRFFGAALFALAVLAILTPRYILPVCQYTRESHQISSCSYLEKAEMAAGFIALGIAVGAFFSKTADALRWLMFSASFAAVSILALPQATGYCASPRMPCNYGTVPMLRLLGGIMLIFSAAGFFLAREKKA